MKDMRRENEPLTVNGMIEFIQDNYSEWLDDYINDIGPTAALSLERLCRRFAYRHGFSKRTATKLQENVAVLAEKKDKYCAQFWGLYSNVNCEIVIEIFWLSLTTINKIIYVSNIKVNTQKLL